MIERAAPAGYLASLLRKWHSLYSLGSEQDLEGSIDLDT